jgi:hypothetical protein
VKAHQAEHPVQTQYRALGVSVSGYYASLDGKVDRPGAELALRRVAREPLWGEQRRRLPRAR